MTTATVQMQKSIFRKTMSKKFATRSANMSNEKKKKEVKAD